MILAARLSKLQINISSGAHMFTIAKKKTITVGDYTTRRYKLTTKKKVHRRHPDLLFGHRIRRPVDATMEPGSAEDAEAENAVVDAVDRGGRRASPARSEEATAHHQRTWIRALPA